MKRVGKCEICLARATNKTDVVSYGWLFLCDKHEDEVNREIKEKYDKR